MWPVCRPLPNSPMTVFFVWQDDGGWSPVIWAAEFRHADIVRYLLEAGANPNLKDDVRNVETLYSNLVSAPPWVIRLMVLVDRKRTLGFTGRPTRGVLTSPSCCSMLDVTWKPSMFGGTDRCKHGSSTMHRDHCNVLTNYVMQVISKDLQA